MKLFLVLVSGLLLFIQNATAGEVTAKILVQDSVSWDGGPFEYAKGTPQITVQKINIAAGKKVLSLAIHCHTIPLAAYVSKGSVQIEKPSGEHKLFKAGDAFIEVFDKWHKGVFVEDTELIAFYAGVKGAALSVKKDSDPSLTKVCK